MSEHDNDRKALDAIAVAIGPRESGSTSGKDVESASKSEEAERESPLKTKKALWAWLLLCYSTGPANGVANRYVPAVLQSAANVLGHVPGSNKPCAKRGKIVCVVPFGTGEVDYNSYVLYLQAISRAVEGVLTILIAGIADYSHFRKSLMIISIILFGTFALPFAALSDQTEKNLVAAASLWLTMAAVSAAYGTMESSYIPLFMRETGWFGKERDHVRMVGEEQHKEQLNRGALVSVLGLISSNLGTITSLLIGVIILHTSKSGAQDGYKDFLIAITVGGCLTIIFGTIGWFMLPSVKGTKAPSKNLPWLAVKNQFALFKSITRYPEVFKLCIGWVLWNTASSNFNSVLGLAFREVTGLGTGDRLYTVYSFMTIVVASMGSLTWMFVFPQLRWKIKTYAYGFLAVHILCALWGTIGISNANIGYKHAVEFWVELAISSPATSALRASNRVMYASMLPRGKEAHFTGLELTLDLAVGWINPLVQSVIQDRTHNLRYPMLPNLFLFLVATGFYIWFDIDKGIADSLKPFDEETVFEEEI